MKTLFTIIVPVFNTAPYLEKCIQSLLLQTMREIEVILVDDGSTDESGRICDGFKHDPRIKVIHKKNEGQGIARNASLETAEGDYVLFIDSDDYIEKNTCARLYEYMKKSNTQLCSFGYVIEDREGKEIYRTKLQERIFRGEEVTNQFLLHFFGDAPEDDTMRGISACMTAFQRSVIERYKVLFPSERRVLSEDTIFNLEFCKHIDTAAVIPEYFYHYVQNPLSFSHSYRPDRFDKTLYLCNLLKEYAAEYGIKDLVKARISMVLWINLMECIKQEVRRTDESNQVIYENIRKMCRSRTTQDALKELSPSALDMKQKIFLGAVRGNWVNAVIVLAKIRNMKGL